MLDCCTSQNKLNCQWVTELDFPGKKFSPHTSPIAGRPMNISNQMIKKWDPECGYIKKWLPQLQDVPAKALHTWFKEWENYKETGYGKPILDYEEERDKTLTMYKQALK